MKRIILIIIIFLVPWSSAVAESPDIVAAEYYINQDPGFGNATPIALNPANMVDVAFNVDISELEEGLHRLYVRTKDATGKWSLSHKRDFFLSDFSSTTPLVASEIVEVEYFFNTDPGTGNANSVTVEPGITIDEIITIDASGLPYGTNRLYTRTKSENGKWSLTYLQTLFIMLSANFSAYPQFVGVNETVQFTDISSGFVFFWEWDFNNDGTVNSEVQHPAWSYSEPGIYSVSLRVSDGQRFSTKVIENYIYVDTEPDILCPDDFSICIDQVPLTLSGAIPAGGVYSGDHVENGIFNPPDPGDYTINYEFSSFFCEYVITVHPQPEITCPEYGPYCSGDPVVTFQETGVFKLNGNVITQFNPNIPGTFTIEYIITNEFDCPNSCFFDIVVNPAPVVSCPGIISVNIEDPPFLLSGASPVGGYYSGAGVADNIFDPTITGAGVFAITYSYVGANGCTGSCGFNVIVTDDEGDNMQILNLLNGWNLISLDVVPENNTPSSVFAELISADKLIYVSGYQNQQGVFFDPYGLPFLNTLQNMNPVEGYWVRLNDDATLIVSGTPISPGFQINLLSGWNLVGYWLPNTQAPADAYASLINAGLLDIVTGFEQTGKFFDPAGPPFLNTLTEIKNGFGYWVRLNQSFPNFNYPNN